MAALYGYLIPDKVFPIGQFAKTIKTILEDFNIANGYYGKRKDLLAAGQNSFFIFSANLNNSNIAFEYVDIHDTINKRLIPASPSEGFGANCKNCKENIDEDLYDSLNDLYEQELHTNIETDMANLEITCSKCGNINKLTDIKFDFETELKNQYIQFVDIESDFNLDKVREIGKLMNCNFKIIYEKI